jgi:hypothetical protein
MTGRSLNSRKLYGALNYLSPKSWHLDRKRPRKRSPRPSGRSLGRKKVYLRERRDLGWFSTRSLRIGYPVGAQIAKRRLKRNTSGSLRISPSILRVALTHLLKRNRRRRWCWRRKSSESWRMIYMLLRLSMGPRVSRVLLRYSKTKEEVLISLQMIRPKSSKSKNVREKLWRNPSNSPNSVRPQWVNSTKKLARRNLTRLIPKKSLRKSLTSN